MTPLPVAVLGGGISGLAAAYYLRHRCPDRPIVLFEKSDRVGGRIASERSNGFVIESGPDGFVTHKTAVLDLCKAIGLGEDIVRTRDGLGPAYVRRNGALYRLPEGLTGLVPSRMAPLLRSSVLSLRGRLRMAAERWVPARTGDDESLDRFLTRRFGTDAAANLFGPLLGGIYGRTDALSARIAVPHLVRMEEEYGSVSRGTRVARKSASSAPGLATLERGMAALPERLHEVLGNLRVDIVIGRTVRTIELGHDGLRIVPGHGDSLNVAGAIVALPCPRAADVIATVAPSSSDILRAVTSASSVVVSIGCSGEGVGRTLDASGYVVADRHRGPVSACTWSSAKFPGRAPSGSCLFRVFLGGDGYEVVRTVGDDGLVEIAMTELAETVGLRGGVDLIRVHRHDDATPHLGVGHGERIEALEGQLASLTHPIELAGNYTEGLGLADAIRSGQRAAERLADRLAARRRDRR